MAKNKGCISWTGLAQVDNGMYGTAAIQALNGLCGTFDAPGGPLYLSSANLNPLGVKARKSRLPPALQS